MNMKYHRRRHFERFSLPITIDIPEFSDMPMIPKDVSVGGVMVVLVSMKPDLDSLLNCRVRISDGGNFRCRARIAWERENKTDPPSWCVGLRFELSKEEQREFERHVKKFVSEYLRAQLESASAWPDSR